MAGWTTYIQWKGTDLCMDMYCPNCGKHSHFDGFNAYVVKCPHCGGYFQMAEEIKITPLGKRRPENKLVLEADEVFQFPWEKEDEK